MKIQLNMPNPAGKTTGMALNPVKVIKLVVRATFTGHTWKRVWVGASPSLAASFVFSPQTKSMENEPKSSNQKWHQKLVIARNSKEAVKYGFLCVVIGGILRNLVRNNFFVLLLEIVSLAGIALLIAAVVMWVREKIQSKK